MTPERDVDSSRSIPPLLADLSSESVAIKEGDTFLYSDLMGDVDDRHERGFGLYHRDTRFLSHFRMWVSGRQPVLLSASSERGYMAHVDLTNPELADAGRTSVPQQSLNVRRIRTIFGRLFERLRVKNYNDHGVSISLAFSFAADFADMFEVRGLARHVRGHHDPPEAEGRRIVFTYVGRDGVRRRTIVELGADPERLEVVGDRVEAEFVLRLAPHQTRVIQISVEPIVDDTRLGHSEFDTAVHDLRRSYEAWERESTEIVTDNELFSQLLARGLRDLRALYMPVDAAHVFAAGIPWYVAVFGRDALLTSHQLLTVSPRPAREALRLLASLQGREDEPWRDEEPGKIVHEIRRGELAGSGEIPHTRYYGTVDATPLFVFLYAQYHRWTADVDFARELRPNVDAALEWIDRYGDADGDGFVEYRCRSPIGQRNQGWKDSSESVVHQDGSVADGPIALAEVQGYVYLAKLRVAEVYEALGDAARADRLRDEANDLRDRFNDAFWMPDELYFAQALDGDKRQVRTVTSNPAQCLYFGIVEPDKAEHVARRILQPDMFSGWGVRTMSKGAKAYNPMSYHNGSVWPHDNAIVAAGLKRYGFTKATNRIATALFDSAVHADYMRLPELFCGFTRRTPNSPVGYPVACSPQAWAAGSPFLLLQAMLGISARAADNLLTVNEPHLPPWLNEVELRNLRVGRGAISLVFRRDGDTTSFSFLDRRGDVRVVMEG